MEINKIKYFRTVYETGSMRKAAELIKMSSGSLSKSIKSLEEELGLKLFIPNGRNIQPTEEAKRVYLKSQLLIESYNNFFQTLDEESKSQEMKVIKIASWEVFSTYFIAQFCIDEIQNTNYLLEVLERPPEHLEASIINGETDIGISYAPIAHPELEFLKISHFTFNIYGRKSLQKATFESVPFAVPIQKVNNSVVGVHELDNWPKQVTRKIKYRFEMLETALETTRQGISAIYCPNFIISLQNKLLKEEYQLKEITPATFPKTKKTDIYIITRKGFPENQIVKKLAKAIRVHCK